MSVMPGNVGRNMCIPNLFNIIGTLVGTAGVEPRATCATFGMMSGETAVALKRDWTSLPSPHLQDVLKSCSSSFAQHPTEIEGTNCFDLLSCLTYL